MPSPLTGILASPRTSTSGCGSTDPGNATRLIAALEDFGFGSLGLSANDFADAGTVVQLGYPPKRIDLLTSIDGLAVPFIDVESLIVNKKASGRPQDTADVAALEAG